MFSPLTQAVGQAFGGWFEPDTEQRMPLGISVDAWDPYWGFATFVYAKAGGTLEKGALVQLSNLMVATDIPNTANTGRSIYVTMNSMVVDEFGWFQRRGMAILSATASVAADTAIGITAAGQVGANSAGKQVLNARNMLAGTATVAKTNVATQANSAAIITSGYDGWFLGIALTGTGIPASTVVAKLDPDGRTVYMGSAIGTVDKLATATGSVTVTGTMTGYLGTMIDCPFVQGAIT